MEIQIGMPNKEAAQNFAKWFREEGFDLFTKSKFNKLKKGKEDSYITCLATDEKLTASVGNNWSSEYAGQYFDLQ